jgi:hypothetical protein
MIQSHADLIQRAADAIQAYLDWCELVEEPMRRFAERTQAIRNEARAGIAGGTGAAAGELLPAAAALRALQESEAAIRRERAAFLRQHPQPPTADQIIEEVARGDGILWTRLCVRVVEERNRRLGRMEWGNAAAVS